MCALCPDYFWDGLIHSNLNIGKELITLAALNSEFHNWYKEHKYYEVLQFPIDINPYLDILSFDKDDELSKASWDFRYSPVSVCVPESLNWAVWNSLDFELCIIGFNKETGADKIPLDPNWWPVNNNWMTIETAITELMPPIFCHQGGQVPKDIADSLIKNYGN